MKKFKGFPNILIKDALLTNLFATNDAHIYYLEDGWKDTN
jgi:hypothetical protein